MVDARVIRAQEKYDEVHKELIEAGIKLLSIKPISSLSLNSLAEYTEVSKTSIYNHLIAVLSIFTMMSLFIVEIIC